MDPPSPPSLAASEAPPRDASTASAQARSMLAATPPSLLSTERLGQPTTTAANEALTTEIASSPLAVTVSSGQGWPVSHRELSHLPSPVEEEQRSPAANGDAKSLNAVSSEAAPAGPSAAGRTGSSFDGGPTLRKGTGQARSPAAAETTKRPPGSGLERLALLNLTNPSPTARASSRLHGLNPDRGSRCENGRGSAHRRGTRHRRDNFDDETGVSYENFFFHNEDAATFGVGTVGLNASRAKPICVAPRAPSKGPGTSTTRQQRRHRAHPQKKPPLSSPRSSITTSFPTPPSAAEDTSAPCYYTPACYTSPTIDAPTAWEQRQAEYEGWRDQHLKESTYYRFSRLPEMVLNVEELGGFDESLCSLRRSSTPRVTEQQQKMEHRRQRAIAAERAAKEQQRAQEKTAYAEQVLQLRARKLHGEPVDLPDSYLRATYPDTSTLTGYAEAVPNSSLNSTYPAACRSRAASAHLMDPQRLVKAHCRAVTLRRVAAQQARLDREHERQMEVERYRQSMEVQLRETRLQEAEFLATWIRDQPKISRAREAERHAQQASDQLSVDRLNRATLKQQRAVYAMYAAEELAASQARQQGLRTQVVATRPCSPQGPTTPRQVAHAAPARDPTNPVVSVADAARVGATDIPILPSPRPETTRLTNPPRNATPNSAVQHLLPLSASVRSRPVTPAVVLSQVVGPTSANFFNEVKQWTHLFPCPQMVPPNGADPAYRRAWKAELDEAQLHFNRASTQWQREDIPRRVQEAREKTLESAAHQAEEGRQKRRELAIQHADQMQADVEAATAMRVGVQEEALRGQRLRQTHAVERHHHTQLLRQQSKRREMLVRTWEAEELQQLQLAVSAAHQTG